MYRGPQPMRVPEQSPGLVRSSASGPSQPCGIGRLDKSGVRRPERQRLVLAELLAIWGGRLTPAGPGIAIVEGGMAADACWQRYALD
jgi:hypothetical protein